MDHDFSAWIGKQETLTDVIDPARSNALRAALGNPEPLQTGDVMPWLHHWLYFWNVQPPESLGSDGHPAKGGFLPPVPLPRRMWAGGRFKFLAPLHLGETVTRTSTVLKVQAKSGKSGDLVFVTVRHELSGPSGTAIEEEQDLVYKGATAAGSIALPAPADAPACTWRETVEPDTVLLFRYSALTMNGHRIHYDRPYAMDEESYPALVVHGPLMATLLADLAARKLGKPLATFDFRGNAPAFDGITLHLCGDASDDGAHVWTQQGAGKCMVASATTA
ncbi:MAG: MaoC family dehydratase N-terminal domain-containing protein [Novosphingobium sp.]